MLDGGNYAPPAFTVTPLFNRSCSSFFFSSVLKASAIFNAASISISFDFTLDLSLVGNVLFAAGAAAGPAVGVVAAAGAAVGGSAGLLAGAAVGFPVVGVLCTPGASFSVFLQV
jgi:hypothetical protein